MGAENETARPENDSTSQISAAIDKIMANPELISMVATALSASSPTVSAEGSEPLGERAENPDAAEAAVSAAPNIEKLPDIAASLAPLLSSLQKGGGAKHSPHADHRACLLSALKPYLSRERCEAIDYMIKLGKLSELFKGLG